jgi:hypothetical protein
LSQLDISKDTIKNLAAPELIKQTLSEFMEKLQKQAGENLAGVILYGGMALGRYRADRSDINIVLLLKDVSIEKLKEISEVIRWGFSEICIEPMIMTPGEVRKSADVFPIKFLHIKKHHVVLYGEDPFADLAVPRQYLRLRVEQELRNSALRTRRAFITFEKDPSKLADIAANVLPALAVDLETLLDLKGCQLPAETSFEAIAAASAKEFQLDAESLLKFASYRENKIRGKDALSAYSGFLSSIARAAEIADEME